MGPSPSNCAGHPSLCNDNEPPSLSNGTELPSPSNGNGAKPLGFHSNLSYYISSYYIIFFLRLYLIYIILYYITLYHDIIILLAKGISPIQWQWAPPPSNCNGALPLQLQWATLPLQWQWATVPSPMALSCPLPPMAMGQPCLSNGNGAPSPLYHIIIFHVKAYYITFHSVILYHIFQSYYNSFMLYYIIS